jgi:hypothetical protein
MNMFNETEPATFSICRRFGHSLAIPEFSTVLYIVLKVQ